MQMAECHHIRQTLRILRNTFDYVFRSLKTRENAGLEVELCKKLPVPYEIDGMISSV